MQRHNARAESEVREHMMRNRKGQTTIEYAVLIGLVATMAVGMLTYGVRAWSGKQADALGYLTSAGSGTINGKSQYSPYYAEQGSTIRRDNTETETVNLGYTIDTTAITQITGRTGTDTTGVDQSQDGSWQ